MKAALRLLLVTTTLVFVGHASAEAPLAKPETVDVSQDRLSRIRTVLQKEIDVDRLPGVVVMIARNRIDFSPGAAHLSGRARCTPRFVKARQRPARPKS